MSTLCRGVGNLEKFKGGAIGVPDSVLPSKTQPSRGSGLRCAAIGGGGVLLAAVAALLVLPFINLGFLAAHAASTLLGRAVAIGELHVAVGRSIVFELRDVHLANAPGTSQVEMATLRALVAKLSFLPLLTGRLHFTSVTVDSPAVVLERDANGRGNWRFRPDARPANPGGVAPPIRAALPGVTALTLHDGDLVFATTSGARLHIELHDIVLRAPAPDQPVVIAAEGAYNRTPIRLVVSGQSMDLLHDPAIPYGATATARSHSASLIFAGTVTDPLRFDGLQGRVQLDAPDIAEVLAAAGLSAGINMPLAMTATLDKHGDAWKLADIAGTLAHNAFRGTGDLLEGARGQADRVAFDVHADSLDLRAIAAGVKPGAGGSFDLPVVDDKPDTVVDGRITVAAARFGAALLSDLSLRARVEPGRLALDDGSLLVAGGKTRIWATAEPAANGTYLRGGVTIANADATQLVRWIGGPSGAVAGHVDGGVTLDLVGETLSRALAASRITGVVGMRDGSITHNLIELASIDLRRLLRKRAGSARLSCLLGIANLKNGSGPLGPLRLRTSDGTIGGGGWIDLARRAIDITIQSEAASTGFFALDVPVRISGPFNNLIITPALQASNQMPLARSDQLNLSPELQVLVRSNPCLGAPARPDIDREDIARGSRTFRSAMPQPWSR